MGNVSEECLLETIRQKLKKYKKTMDLRISVLIIIGTMLAILLAILEMH